MGKRNMIQDTSLTAYAEIHPALGAMHVAVVDVFKASPGRDFSNSELAAKLTWTINRVTPRVNELRKMGILEESVKRPCRVTGRMVHSWQLTGRVTRNAPQTFKETTFKQVPSRSVRGLTRVIKETEGKITCSCPGFLRWGRCRHLREIKKPQDLMVPLF